MSSGIKAETEAGESEEQKSEESDVIIVSMFKPKKIPQLMWRECTPRALLSGRLKKIWEVDPLLCSQWGSLMKLIRFIYERKIIKKILDHLDFYEEATSIVILPAR